MGVEFRTSCRNNGCTGPTANRKAESVVLRINNIRLRPGHDERALYNAVAKQLHKDIHDIAAITIARRSIDARRHPDIFYIYSVNAELKKRKTNRQFLHAQPKDADRQTLRLLMKQSMYSRLHRMTLQEPDTKDPSLPDLDRPECLQVLCLHAAG